MIKELRQIRKLLHSPRYAPLLEIVMPNYNDFLHRYNNKHTPTCVRDVRNDLIYVKQILKLNRGRCR